MPCKFAKKLLPKDESAGRGESRAGSHERELNTVAHGRSRNFRRNNGRGQGRGRRGNGNIISSATGNSINGGYTSTNLNGNSYENNNTGGTGGGRGRGRGNRARGRRGRGRNDGKDRHGRCNYYRNSTEHGWHDCPLRHSHQQRLGLGLGLGLGEKQHADTTRASPAEASTSQAWCTSTENAELENFQVVVGDGAESPSHDEMQKDIAFPAMVEIGTSTPPRGTAVFIDTAASSNMVTAESRLRQHVVDTIACSVRIKVKGHADFRAQRPKGRSCFDHEMNEVRWYRSAWKC